MSERRRRYSFYESGRSDPIVEERRPERARSPVPQRRRTVIFTATPVRSHRKERVERSPSPVRYVRRPRAPTPPPRSYTPPVSTTIIMPPKQTPALKPILVSKPLPPKKEDNKPKAVTKPSDKPKEGPRVKVYEKSHRSYNSLDSGHASGFSSPWSVEERSPLDYVSGSIIPTTSPVPKSPKPRVDKEPYEIIMADGRSRYIKTGSDRPKDAPATTERKKEARYVIRTPESPGLEAEIVPAVSAKPGKVSKDGYAPSQRATRVLQEQLAKEPEKVARPKETLRSDESKRLAEIKLKQLEADIERMRLEQQIAEGRAAEAERRLKQQKIDDLERRDRDLKQQQQQAEERRKREASLARREAKLKNQQWEEIEATPPPSAAPLRRTAALVEQGQLSRRHTLMTPYGSGALTTTTSMQPGSLLGTEDPFLAPILEAQRDEDARRAREARDGRRGILVKETARSGRPRRRDGDDRYHV